MNEITLYLDMDGVLADFNKEYLKENPNVYDRKRFYNAVMFSKIFLKLDYMPDAYELLNHCKKLHDVNIEILTSMGTHDPIQGGEAKRQKLIWLEQRGITYKANFVRTKAEKANFATPRSILVDDSVGCIAPFLKEGGRGVLHKNSSESIAMIDALIANLRETEVTT